MKEQNFNLLIKLMNGVIGNNNHSNKMTIVNPQYNEMYLRIFLDEIESNNGEPVPYDTFGDRLWIKLNKDVNLFPKEAEEFMGTWNRWVDLYQYLKNNNKIK